MGISNCSKALARKTGRLQHGLIDPPWGRAALHEAGQQGIRRGNDASCITMIQTVKYSDLKSCAPLQILCSLLAHSQTNLELCFG